MPEEPLTHVSVFDPEDEYRPEPEPEPVPPAWMDGSLRIGIHTSIAGSHLNALESAHKLGCNALQIFSASPRMWTGGAVAVRGFAGGAQALLEGGGGLRVWALVVIAKNLVIIWAPPPMFLASLRF